MNTQHLPEEKKFIIDLGEDFFAELDYLIRDQIMILTHTRVPRQFEGNRFAEKITKVALEYAQENHLKVQPQCSYSVHFLNKHPEYKQLLR